MIIAPYISCSNASIFIDLGCDWYDKLSLFKFPHEKMIFKVRKEIKLIKIRKI